MRVDPADLPLSSEDILTSIRRSILSDAGKGSPRASAADDDDEEPLLLTDADEASPPREAPRAPASSSSPPPPPRLSAIERGFSSGAGASAFARLEKTVRNTSSGGHTIEDVVRAMLQPMLKEWLDKNLHGLVEHLVQREIERLVAESRKHSDPF